MSYDKSAAAKQAWVTRRQDWIKTPTFENFKKDFDFWSKTDEGISELKEHQEKVEYIRSTLSKENLKKITEQEFFECWIKLYASQIISGKGQEVFFQSHIINANDGFENLRTKLIELIHGTESIPIRFEKGIKDIKQFGDATVSEILNNLYPEECCIWNDVVRKAIPILGISRLVPKKILEGTKKITKEEDYEKCNLVFSLIKDELSSIGIKDYYELDHFFWYVESRKYWRIQPGENGDWWDEQRKNNIIGVNWNIKEDLSKVDDISEVVIKNREKERGHSTVTKQLENFLNVIQIGDFVVANNGFSEILGVGKVVSGYNYDSKFAEFPHIRGINWYDVSRRTIPKQDWGRITINKLDLETFERITETASSTIPLTPHDPLLEKFKKILQDKKQIVLYGPPGTGKTFFARRLASMFYSNEYLDIQDPSDTFQILQNAGFTDLVQFHPSYSYEDFVEGIRPKLNEDSTQLDYKVQNGIFKKFCLEADYVNDEIDHYFALINDYAEIKKPITATNLGLPQSFGGGMNEISSDNFKKILEHAYSHSDDDFSEEFEKNNFSGYFRLNTKENSPYGDIDGVRYHFSEDSNAPKKFLTAIQTGNVAVAYHDRERDGFIGIGITQKNNFIQNPKFVLIIDEINRGNLSKIFGELIYGLEYRDTPIKTQYSEFEGTSSFLKIPKNLLVIGTMNTADRSISLFDTALRRRFAFIELLPDYNLLAQLFEISEEYDSKEFLEKLKSEENKIKILSVLSLDRLNQEILNNIQLGREKQIGHSYLIPLADDQSKFYNIWRYEIIPLLEEFYYAESEILENLLEKNIFDKNMGIQDFTEDELIASLTKLVNLAKLVTQNDD